MKKGDILKFKNHKERGLTSNCFFYCKGLLDDEPIYVTCIIKQNGDILTNNEIVNISLYKNDLIKTTIEEFISNKFNYTKNTTISFNHKIYEHGIIRNINEDNKTLTIEIEDNYNYDEIKINYNDVLIVYPEFTFNNKHKYNELNKK